MPRISELLNLDAILFLHQGLQRILEKSPIGHELGRSLTLAILNIGSIERLPCNIWILLQKLTLSGNSSLLCIFLSRNRHILSACHRKCPGKDSCQTRQKDYPNIVRRTGHPDYYSCDGNNTIVGS